MEIMLDQVLYKREKKKRGKMSLLQATHCQFCGEKYPEATAWGVERSK